MAKPASFIALLHKRVASLAIGASTVRGMGPKGTAKRARKLLARVNLDRFSVNSKREFDGVLDRVTESFRRSLPRGDLTGIFGAKLIERELTWKGARNAKEGV